MIRQSSNIDEFLFDLEENWSSEVERSGDGNGDVRDFDDCLIKQTSIGREGGRDRMLFIE